MNIALISDRFELTQDTLRYYERIGLIPAVRRNKSGNRDYRDDDCQWIEFIKCMRGAGLPIEKLVEYVTLFQQGEVTIEARKELLCEQYIELEQKMKEMQNTMEKLKRKISHYESIRKTEKNLKVKDAKYE